jgi:hypothetical protein
MDKDSQQNLSAGRPSRSHANSSRLEAPVRQPNSPVLHGLQRRNQPQRWAMQKSRAGLLRLLPKERHRLHETEAQDDGSLPMDRGPHARGKRGAPPHQRTSHPPLQNLPPQRTAPAPSLPRRGTEGIGAEPGWETSAHGPRHCPHPPRTEC